MASGYRSMSGNLVCSMPLCQTTAGCRCVDWPAWAATQFSRPYIVGRHAIRLRENPYVAGTWEHEQWVKGYTDIVPSGG